MRRVIPLLARNLPLLTKKMVAFTLFYSYQKYYSLQSFFCFPFVNKQMSPLTTIEANMIRIQSNGEVIGYAYCFQQNYLVLVSHKINNHNREQKSLQFFIGDQKLAGTFKVVGNYQNLIFIQYTLSKRITPMTAVGEVQSSEYSQVQLLQKKQFLSIHDAYLVSRDSGYRIVSGVGEAGNLVVRNGLIAGIITQKGMDDDAGFLRMMEWQHLPNLLAYVKGKKLHLGLSVQCYQSGPGIFVVRMAPNSPLNKEVMMGDIILSANGQKVRNPQSLYRICLQSNGKLYLGLLREGQHIDVQVLI